MISTRVALLALAVAGVTLALAPGAEFPADVRVERDVAYLAADRRHKADLYFPTRMPEGGRVPAVVIIHGGGFTKGHKDDRREINIGTTLAQHGYLGMSIDYQLWSTTARHPTWPQCLYDAKTAVRWLRLHADELDIDPERIGVIGGSAGGNLAAMLGVTGPDDGLEPPEGDAGVSSRVQCVVNLYGVVDLLNHHDMKMLHATREEDPDVYRRASPITHCTAGDAPVLIIHGTADKTVALSQSEAFARALEAAGVEHELLIVPGAPHTFDLDYPKCDVKTPVLAFFNKHLQPSR
jgi:acetyl esterase/lipase